MNDNYWKTKDGRLLNVRDMETSHLLNTIRFLNRKFEYELSLAAFDFDDYDEDVSYNHKIEDYWPCYKLMIKEAKRRGFQKEAEKFAKEGRNQFIKDTINKVIVV